MIQLFFPLGVLKTLKILLSAALDLLQYRVYESKGTTDEIIMLFSAQQVIIWSSGTTWFWDHAFMLGWCCGTEITPVLALKNTNGIYIKADASHKPIRLSQITI